MPAKKTAKSTYTATLKIWGKDFVGKGATTLDALTNIKPGGVGKGRGILVISNGKEEKTRIIPPLVVARLFNASPTMREINLKRTSSLFSL